MLLLFALPILLLLLLLWWCCLLCRLALCGGSMSGLQVWSP